MAWLDDRVPLHPKIVGLSDRGFRHWIGGLCYCSAHGTRGNLDAAVIALRTPKRTIAELVSAGVWDQHEGGLYVHDWAAHNEKRDEQRAARRASDRRRQALFRDPELRAAVRERDGDRCRYCAREVNWNDRKGMAGATYDHVDPDGENTLENLVVCCRSCNSIKRGRSVEQAGMRLRDLPEFDSDLDRDLDRNLDQDQARDLPLSRARAGARPNDHDQENDHTVRDEDLSFDEPLLTHSEAKDAAAGRTEDGFSKESPYPDPPTATEWAKGEPERIGISDIAEVTRLARAEGAA